MTITRYRPDSDEQDRTAMMWEDKEGDYVAYEDYEDEVNALKSEIARLKAERYLLFENGISQGRKIIKLREELNDVLQYAPPLDSVGDRQDNGGERCKGRRQRSKYAVAR